MPKRKFTLKTERRRLPNGVTRTIRMIDHPGAVLIVPFVNSRRVILLRQYRPALRAYLHEFPCGTLEAGERPLACARRELAEESGFGARSWKKLGEIFTAPGFTNEKIHLYAATDLFVRQADRDPDEIISVTDVSRDDIKDMLRRGRLRDAKTLCALALCGWHV
ncbi:MAG: NUDIX hydrolase [Candidatus Omnitrophica bacterium]|nr:NUDIX hydrolase [Candidatus Omnitrophota bacterium]MCB9720445.1 NUDIX hydrolase [Candidatus Omnitrophota bacterium]